MGRIVAEHGGGPRYDPTPMDADELAAELLHGDGFCVVPDVLPAALTAALRTQVLAAVAHEAALLADLDPSAYGRVLELAPYGGAFLDLLAFDPLFAPVEALLGADATLQTFSSSCVPPHGTNSASRAHVDQRTSVPDYLTSIGIFVLLDDFRASSGGTQFLAGSQRSLREPSADEFDAAGTQIDASAGSVCYFHPRAWHRSLPNRSDDWRCCVIPAMTRPWVRQRFDLPRLVDPALLAGRPEVVRRRIGFEASSPSSYEEYYERRRSASHRRT